MISTVWGKITTITITVFRLSAVLIPDFFCAQAEIKTKQKVYMILFFLFSYIFLMKSWSDFKYFYNSVLQ